MNCGGGIVAAYEAGAKITNMEFSSSLMLNGGFPRDSAMLLKQLTKYPMLLDSNGVDYYKQTGNRLLSGAPTKDSLLETDVLMEDYTGISEEAEAISKRMFAIGSPHMLAILKERGGLAAAPFEVRRWSASLFRGFSGVMFNERGESSLKGLYVAGDVGGGVANYGATQAFVWGMLCADYAAGEAMKTEMPAFDRQQEQQVRAAGERFLAPLGRKEGVNPVELEYTVRSIVDNYVGIKKTEPRLKRGLELFKVIREKFVPALMARNPHELLRAVEVQNALTIAELHTAASIIRTETRMAPYHYRVDYPEQDDANWRKNLVLKNVAGNMEHTLEVRE